MRSGAKRRVVALGAAAIEVAARPRCSKKVAEQRSAVAASCIIEVAARSRKAEVEWQLVEKVGVAAVMEPAPSRWVSKQTL